MATLDASLGTVRVRFGELVGTMSPRDRRLFAGLVIGVLLFVVGGAGWVAKRYLADLRARVSDEEQTLQLIDAMAADYESSTKDIARIEDELRRHSGEELSPFMEKAAGKVGIGDNLKAVREKGAPRTDGNLETRTFSVELSGVTLQQLVDFLYEVEATSYPLQITSTRVKASGQAGARVLAVSMEVSAFRLTDAAPAPDDAPGPPPGPPPEVPQ